MKCWNCWIDVSHSVKVSGRTVCKDCAGKMGDFSKSISGVGNDENGDGKHCVANEILAYMHRSAMSRTPEEIVNECAEKYAPEDILGAKIYLLNEYGD